MNSDLLISLCVYFLVGGLSVPFLVWLEEKIYDW